MMMLVMLVMIAMMVVVMVIDFTLHVTYISRSLKVLFKKASGTNVVVVYVSLVISNVPLRLVMVLVMVSMWWRTIFLF